MDAIFVYFMYIFRGDFFTNESLHSKFIVLFKIWSILLYPLILSSSFPCPRFGELTGWFEQQHINLLCVTTIWAGISCRRQISTWISYLWRMVKDTRRLLISEAQTFRFVTSLTSSHSLMLKKKKQNQQNYGNKL